MSSINVYCDEISWGEILPNICLVQAGDLASEDSLYETDNKVPMKRGYFGLTISNDPFVVYSKPPRKDPYSTEEFGDDEVKNKAFDEEITIEQHRKRNLLTLR